MAVIWKSEIIFCWSENLVRKGKDCCSAGTSMAQQDLLTSGAGRTSKRTSSNENDNFVQFSDKYLSDSQKGSHGLITYASDTCAGGNETLTKPCPKVCRNTKRGYVSINRYIYICYVSKWTELQGSCLNYNLQRYPCFLEDVDLSGSGVGPSVSTESKKVINILSAIARLVWIYLFPYISSVTIVRWTKLSIWVKYFPI